jgi:hypothetical protein
MGTGSKDRASLSPPRRGGRRSASLRCSAGRGTCLSQHDRLHPAPAAASGGNQGCAGIVHRGGPFGGNVCSQDGFQRITSEERRCFGVRAAERSIDTALVLPEEASSLPSASQSGPLQAVRNLGILNKHICGPTLTGTVCTTFPRPLGGRAKRPR